MLRLPDGSMLPSPEVQVAGSTSGDAPELFVIDIKFCHCCKESCSVCRVTSRGCDQGVAGGCAIGCGVVGGG